MSHPPVLPFNRFTLNPDTIIFTNEERNEVCRLTEASAHSATLEESFQAVRRILHSVDQLPAALNALQMLVEKVNRANDIERSGGRLAAEDWTELKQLAFAGQAIVLENQMLAELDAAGYAVQQREGGAFYYWNEFVDSPASKDFDTRYAAIEAAHAEIRAARFPYVKA